MDLIIIESPNKISTIEKYLIELGKKDFKIFSSNGHIIDLDEKSYCLHRDNNGVFTADYQTIKGKHSLIKELKNLVSMATNIFMCQDADREGERISSDIVDVCKIKKYYRVTFNAITKNAIKKALIDREGVRLIDEQIVLAQWTRRVVDRVIGYGLSPVLFYYFTKNKILSYKKDGEDVSIPPKGTGRVIGISLGILAKRQKEIDLYNETGGYVTDVVVARYTLNGVAFDGRGEKLEFLKKDTEKLNHVISEANSSVHKVYDYKPDTKVVTPYPALNSPSLYSGCSYIYNMPPTLTKKIAQELFETGYITYPRTDNINLESETSSEIIDYLMSTFPEENQDDILKKKRKFRKKKRNLAEEPHEAIRPTLINAAHSPENIKKVWEKGDLNPKTKAFDNQHFFVYSLIWYRTISTQLIDSLYDVSVATISAGEYTFVARANRRIVDGWEKYYNDILNASEKGKGDDDWTNKRVVLPDGLRVGLILNDPKVEYYEKHSRSPKRISEGALISQLSSNEIARPSTIHTASSTLIKKGYATSNRTLLTPTDLGMAVFNVTETFLPWINNIKDAQQFEQVIEAIEQKKISNIHDVIQIYWDKVEEFKEAVSYVEYKDREPSPKQIELGNKILQQMKDEEKRALDIHKIFASQELLSKFIDAKLKERKKEQSNNTVGSCPKCKKTNIVELEKMYKCNTSSCDFILWNNQVDGFINFFKVPLSKKDLVLLLLKDTKATINTTNPKTGQTYSSNIEIKYDEKYKNWKVDFVKNK